MYNILERALRRCVCPKLMTLTNVLKSFHSHASKLTVGVGKDVEPNNYRSSSAIVLVKDLGRGIIQRRYITK